VKQASKQPTSGHTLPPPLREIPWYSFILLAEWTPRLLLSRSKGHCPPEVSWHNQEMNPQLSSLWHSALTNYSALSLTSTLEGRFGQRPGMTPYPLYRKLGGAQGSSARVLKMLLPPGYVPWTVQTVASRMCMVQKVHSLA